MGGTGHRPPGPTILSRKAIEGRRHMSKRFIGSRQTTIGREIELSGTGVHSGAPVSMVLHPAEADTGFRFLVSKRGRIISEIPGRRSRREKPDAVHRAR